jgi:hypothetical protein
MKPIKKLGDIELQQWFELKEYLESEPDDSKIAFQMLNILCEISPLESRRMQVDELDKVISQLNDIVQQKPNFAPIFTHKGIEYGFIPNLDEVTAGEFVDLQKYETDFHTKGINLYKIMSVLYRPVIDKASFDHYKIQPYDGRLNEAFRTMPIDVALGGHLFFCDLGNDLLTYIQKSLVPRRTEKVNKIQTKLAGALKTIFKVSTKSGDGLDGLSDYVTTILETLQAYRNYPCINVSYLPVINSTTIIYKKN